MNWKNANIDGVPDHDNQVLLCVEGVYHLAHYRKTMKGFRLEDGSYFLPDHNNIYWIEVPSMQSESAENIIGKSRNLNKA